MEIKDVVISAMVVLVAVIGITTYLGSMNTAYNMQAGAGFNNTMLRAQNLLSTNLSRMSIDVANNTQIGEGAGSSDQEQSLLAQSRGTLSTVTDLLGIIPSLIEDGASIVGIPEAYTQIAKWSFLFVFGLTIAYIIFLGVKSFVSR